MLTPLDVAAQPSYSASLRRTQDFYRLFMVPGMNHCGGGYATSQFDAFSALVNWVEHGQGPAALLGTAPADTPWPGRTRPICAYPTQARYVGHGSIEDAANFVCVPVRDDVPEQSRRIGHDDHASRLVGHLPELVHLEPSQVIGRADGVEKRRFTECGHSDIPILHVGALVRRQTCCVQSAQQSAGRRCHLHGQKLCLFEPSSIPNRST